VKVFRTERRGNLELKIGDDVEIAAVACGSLAMTSKAGFSAGFVCVVRK
jgi:hypothetical protein